MDQGERFLGTCGQRAGGIGRVNREVNDPSERDMVASAEVEQRLRSVAMDQVLAVIKSTEVMVAKESPRI